MFKIGEFSRLTCLSVRMLRYYDEMGLLRPARTDRQTGYRFYGASQIPLADRIRMLRDLGFGVEEIRKVLGDWSPDKLALLLQERRRSLEGEMLEKLARFDGALARLMGTVNPPELKIMSVPAYHVFSLRRVIPDYYSEGAIWKELAALAEEWAVPLDGRSFSIYHDPDYREENVDVELCALLKEGSSPSFDGYRDGSAGLLSIGYTEPVAYMASSMVHGPFENIAGAYLAFAEYLESQPEYTMGETSRQWVHKGPWNADRPEDYLTEIQIPLQKYLGKSTLDPHTM